MQKSSVIIAISGIVMLNAVVAHSSDKADHSSRNKMEQLLKAIKGSSQISIVPAMKCGTPVTLAVHRLAMESGDMTLGALQWREDTLSQSFGGEHILIHYTLNGANAPYEVDVDTDPADGVPDFINRMLESFEYVRDYQTVTLGYNEPLTDFDRGGDDRYDVYVVNLGAGFYGFTVPEDVIEGYRANSFIEIENDFAGSRFAENPFDGMHITAAHEFFHAVQFAYDAFEFDYDNINDPNTYRPWWFEASSTWMEDIIYDDVNDYLEYLPFFYGYPWMGLGSFSYNYGNPRAYHPYASCVWPIYLTERFDLDVMRQIWEECGSVGGYNTLNAIDEILQPESDLSTAFLEFAIWNFHAGIFADTARFYSEGNLFPEMDSSIYIDELTPDTVSIDDSPHPPEHLAANYVVIRAGQDSGGVALEFDGQDMTESEWHVAMLGYEPMESEWHDIFVDSHTGVGSGEFRGWNDYQDVVVVPTVSGLIPLQDQYEYGGSVVYDPGLVPDTTVAIWPYYDVIPAQLSITSIFPNPFNSSTAIDYTLAQPGEITLSVYNLLGQQVATVYEGTQEAGEHSMVWDASDFPSGVYFARLEAGGISESMKMVLLK